MKHLQLIITTVIAMAINIATLAQQDNSITANETTGAKETVAATKKQLNFFIISKRKKGKLDLATRFNVFRTKLKSFFRPQTFVSIVAKDAEQMSAKVQSRLNKDNARVGTIWFDSHGMYKKGYSLFFTGKDEVSYETLKDSSIIQPLQRIADFAGTGSKIVIGSCYGGATYRRSSVDYTDTTRMNGDSLMISLGTIFAKSSIYGCESWVMTKPGLFQERAAVAGFPGRKLFRDVCYQPAWENLGKWNEYDAVEKKFTSVNTITLDTDGNLKIRIWPYTGHDDVNKYIRENLEKLGMGLYK
jgi:hypothetical protein